MRCCRRREVTLTDRITRVCEAAAEIANAMAPIEIDGVEYTMLGLAVPPPKIDTASVPMLFPLTGSATNNWITGGSDSNRETRQFQLHVPVLPKGAGIPDEPEKRCRTIIEAVNDNFASYPKLNGCLGVEMATVLGDSGIITLPNYEGWVGFITRLQVVLFLHRTFAPGE